MGWEIEPDAILSFVENLIRFCQDNKIRADSRLFAEYFRDAESHERIGLKYLAIPISGWLQRYGVPIWDSQQMEIF